MCQVARQVCPFVRGGAKNNHVRYRPAEADCSVLLSFITTTPLFNNLFFR